MSNRVLRTPYTEYTSEVKIMICIWTSATIPSPDPTQASDRSATNIIVSLSAQEPAIFWADEADAFACPLLSKGTDRDVIGSRFYKIGSHSLESFKLC